MMVGDVLAGRYELEELVGSRRHVDGVSRARLRVLDQACCAQLGSSTCISAATTEYVERFLPARRDTVAGLSHQNIVTVIDPLATTAGSSSSSSSTSTAENARRC